jgi:hypothetical protein
MRYLTMKYKTTALALLLSLSSTTAHSEALSGIESVALIFGGWSNHQTEDSDWYNYNEDHDIKGIMFNNEYSVAVFENSYYRQSVLFSYNWRLWDASIYNLNIAASINTGIVTGYESYNEMGIAYLGGGLSVHVMPTLHVGYQLTNKFEIGVDFGWIPSNNGYVTTSSLNLTYKF